MSNNTGNCPNCGSLSPWRCGCVPEQQEAAGTAQTEPEARKISELTDPYLRTAADDFLTLWNATRGNADIFKPRVVATLVTAAYLARLNTAL